MKFKTRLEPQSKNQLALVTELFNINVNLFGQDLGKCDCVEIWHNDGFDNFPSCIIYPTKEENPFGRNDIIFKLTKDSIEIRPSS